MFQEMIIVGNLGADPEMRFTPSGQQVTSFGVATNRTYTNTAGEQVKETVWFRCETWGKQAENCKQYLHKGSKVLVTGRLKADPATGGPRIWVDQQGNHRASFELNASTVRFLSSNGQHADEAPAEAEAVEETTFG